MLLPALNAKGIRFCAATDVDHAAARAGSTRYFEREVEPVLSPLGLDPAHPFPRILNKSLNFIVELEGKDAFGRDGDLRDRAGAALAAAHHPRCRRRRGGRQRDFVFLSAVVQAFVDELFPGMEVKGCYQFRVTRNSDLFVDEEEVDDLARALEASSRSAATARPCGSRSPHDCPKDLARFPAASTSQLGAGRSLPGRRAGQPQSPARRSTTWSSGPT